MNIGPHVSGALDYLERRGARRLTARSGTALVREWLDENRKELEGNWDLARTHKLPEPCRAEINELMKVSDVEPLKGHRLLVTFSDGAVQEVDVAGLLEVGGMFAPITTAGLSSSSTREPGHADSRMARGIQPRQKSLPIPLVSPNPCL